MNDEMWRVLFDVTEPDETLNLYLADDTRAFVAHIDRINELTLAYEADHNERRIDVRFVRFEEPAKLRRCLHNLKRFHTEDHDAPKLRASSFARLQKLNAADLSKQANAMELIERFEAFQAEGWPHLNPQQNPNERDRAQQRIDAAQKDRPGGRKLPPVAELRAEFNEIAAKKGGSFAAGILAKKYGVTPAAVRKARRKKKGET